MHLITLDQVSLTYTERPVLQSVSLTIQSGDRIGIIGINGSGKTTLMRLIAGLERPDSGEITRMNGLRLEFLPQQPQFHDEQTVMQAVLHGNSSLMQLVRSYEEAAAVMQVNPDNRQNQQTLMHLSAEMDRLDGWNLDHEARAVLSKLGVDQYHQQLKTLSGGQKKRVSLAAALINPADLLILDEPTNHIDTDAVAWLEKYLSSYPGALLIVTHDRYFLDRVTRTIFEIDQSRLFRYEANYHQWLELKAQRQALDQASELKRQSLLRKELAWISRGAKARSTKQKARIDRFEQLSQAENIQTEQSVAISKSTSRLGRKTLILDNVSISAGGKLLVRDLSFIVGRRERLGIIGPNGCGKTTLLDLLAGLRLPDQGSREIGKTVKIGYFRQIGSKVDPEIRVIEYLRQSAEIVKTDDGEWTASQMLERFLFPPSLQWSPVRLLSGGEFRRLELLHVLMSAPNILLLDEPTNDLDISTLTALEDYLDHFPGAVLTVSHDRWFLDRVAQHLLTYQKDGLWAFYPGLFSDYQSARQDGPADSFSDQTLGKKMTGRRTSRSDMLKMSYIEKRDYDQIDRLISDLEEQLAELLRQQTEAGHDYIRLQEIETEMADMRKEHENLMDRWLYLSELAEAIEHQANDDPGSKQS